MSRMCLHICEKSDYGEGEKSMTTEWGAKRANSEEREQMALEEEIST